MSLPVVFPLNSWWQSEASTLDASSGRELDFKRGLEHVGWAEAYGSALGTPGGCGQWETAAALMATAFSALTSMRVRVSLVLCVLMKVALCSM